MVSAQQMTVAELAAHTEPDPDGGIGALVTERGNLPLAEIDLTTDITGLAVRTELTQGFRNPYDEPLEATYVFPLPDRSAVTALSMRAGGRVVDGVLRERGAARADYEQAIVDGRRAAIVEEERPGVFTMRVGNIMPGERVVIRLVLAGLLPVEDGAATFRFPLVVAPRFVPGTPLGSMPVGSGTYPDTDAVPDASRITPPVLLPGFPNPIRLSARIDIDPTGLPLAELTSSLPLRADTENPLRLYLQPGERADRDLVLRLRLGDPDALTASFVVRPDDPARAEDKARADDKAGTGGTFALTLLPPNEIGAARPREVVLLLDRSGSMGGWKMVAARRAAARIVDTLTEADSFAVLAFDHEVAGPPELPSGLVPASDRNRFRAVEHLAAMTARGGTQLLEPLRTAVDLLRAADSTGADRDRVVVLVTDGQVGNEDQILRALAPLLPGIRVHTVGVDSAVNEAFLRRLSGLAGGRCELVESEDRLDEAMRAIHRRIATPLVTDLRISAGSLPLDADSLAPQPVPDLFAGAPILLTGRFGAQPGEPAPAGTVTVTGKSLGGNEWSRTLTAVPSDNAALAAIWARARVRDLEDRYVGAQVGGDGALLAELEQEIIRTSLTFGVLCRFTAFVAVDSSVVNTIGEPKQVIQPVETPAGWEMSGPSPASLPAAVPLGLSATGGGGMSPGSPMPMAGLAEDLSIGAPPAASAPGQSQGRAKQPKAARRLSFGAAAVLPAVQSSTPPLPPVPDSVRRFAAQALRRLADSAGRPLADRVAALAELADAIGKEIDGFAADGLGEPELALLRTFASELDRPVGDQIEWERRWLYALDVLQPLAGDETAETGQPAENAPSKPFWTR